MSHHHIDSSAPPELQAIVNLEGPQKLDAHHSSNFQAGTDYQQGVLDGYEAAKGSHAFVNEPEFQRGFKVGQALRWDKKTHLKEDHHDPGRSGGDYEQGLKDGLRAAPGSMTQVTHEHSYKLGFKEGQRLIKEGGHGHTALDDLEINPNASVAGQDASTGLHGASSKPSTAGTSATVDDIVHTDLHRESKYEGGVGHSVTTGHPQPTLPHTASTLPDPIADRQA